MKRYIVQALSHLLISSMKTCRTVLIALVSFLALLLSACGELGAGGPGTGGTGPIDTSGDTVKIGQPTSPAFEDKQKTVKNISVLASSVTKLSCYGYDYEIKIYTKDKSLVGLSNPTTVISPAQIITTITPSTKNPSNGSHVGSPTQHHHVNATCGRYDLIAPNGKIINDPNNISSIQISSKTEHKTDTSTVIKDDNTCPDAVKDKSEQTSISAILNWQLPKENGEYTIRYKNNIDGKNCSPALTLSIENSK